MANYSEEELQSKEEADTTPMSEYVDLNEYEFTVTRELGQKVFDYVLQSWPQEVEVSDIEIQGPDIAFSASLSKQWGLVEDKIKKAIEEGTAPTFMSEDSAGELEYVFYGCVHKAAQESRQKVYPHNIRFKTYETQFAGKHG
ncbi:hypothetical protein [Kordiimonas aquimaris]|uniref:hypothetical protein n=1 Tax=Kordiimonas aquimaris TaxID=707591 RepID=UPI0021D06471|nr:hypothetical protein [Kordiimonas aquimaris]